MSALPFSRTGAAFLFTAIVVTPPAHSQANPGLDSFFTQNIGLAPDQIADIRKGKPVVKALPPRTQAEVFLFGAIFITGSPDRYLESARNLARQHKSASYLGVGLISSPPQLSDWDGFQFDVDDVQALKGCKPGGCKIQLPATSIQEFQRAIDWTAPDVSEQINRLLRHTANARLRDYQRQGAAILGSYHDKRDPIEVAQQFAYMLSYASALPAQLPDFYRYLLDYPNAKPANVEDAFYWAKVKFGLKPTLRVVHVLTMRGYPTDPVAGAIAEKQLYASHYFETAMDLTFCVRGQVSGRPGFYLILTMGSEQAGLSGPKGSMIRKAAVGRSLSTLRDALLQTRSEFEN
jgi:hypothetical protein